MNKNCMRIPALIVALCGLGWGATFGRVVPIGGQASDLALDEARGVLYIANFTGARVDRLTLADNTIRDSISVAPQPGSLSLSPNGRWLLIAHYGAATAPATPSNALTLIDLTTNGRQVFNLGYTPFGVQFGVDNRALIVTSNDFEILDPTSGVIRVLTTISGLTARPLPVPPGQFPPNIVAASLARSGDSRYIYGLTDTFEFGYDVLGQNLQVITYVSSPPSGPRVVSVNQDGSQYLAFWISNKLLNGQFVFNGGVSQFPNPTGTLNLGSHIIDSKRGLAYAQVAQSAPTGSTGAPATPTSTAPAFTINDLDNLNVRDRILLQENFAGKSVITADNDTVYTISDSGVTVLPVGQLDRAARLSWSTESLAVRANFCNRQSSSTTVVLNDPSGQGTDFSLSSDTAGVTISPQSGRAPATIRVTVDPNAFTSNKGTVLASIRVNSQGAVNLPAALRVAVNLRDPDQQGIAVDVPGQLVDVIADPKRNQFFLLRQDNNTVLVYNSTNLTRKAVLRVGNTPMQMAISFDQQFLLVGADNSMFISVFDLDTLQPQAPVLMPGGHYPRSIAALGNTILVANRVAGPVNTIDQVDLASGTATTLPTLGTNPNSININTVLTASPNGGSVLGLSADGVLRLFAPSGRALSVFSRNDLPAAPRGAYAASSLNQFVAGQYLLNSSLVRTQTFETGSGSSTGFLFAADGSAIRTTTPALTAPGVIQRVALDSGSGIRPTRLVESTVTQPDPANIFTRTLALTADGANLVVLTVSGFTVVPVSYDASVAPPNITAVLNAADGGATLAPGGLISIFGSQLSPVSAASAGLPLPFALADSCLTVNGLPTPVSYISPTQINAQLPFQATGNTQLVLRTPGGVSNSFNFTLATSAPGIFRTLDPNTGDLIPILTRGSNGQIVTLSNPVHRNDKVVIYSTGLGLTNPAVETGQPSPSGPLANAIIKPKVTLGGQPVNVDFAGLAPNFAGLYQINVSIPSNAPQGFSVPLKVEGVGNSTTVNVRVVN